MKNHSELCFERGIIFNYMFFPSRGIDQNVRIARPFGIHFRKPDQFVTKTKKIKFLKLISFSFQS